MKLRRNILNDVGDNILVWDPNIVDISCALFTLSLSMLILNSQYVEGGRDLNNI